MTRSLSTFSFALVSLTSSLAFAAPPDSEASTEVTSGAPASESAEATRDDGPPLLFGHDIAVGGYGGLDVLYTRMFGRDGVAVGAQGAILIEHRLALGVAGYGFSNPLSGPVAPDGSTQHFDTGYGGVTARYSFFLGNLPVYPSLGVLVGGGAIDLTKDDEIHFDDDHASGDVFAVVQPDITLHANLTNWMRLGLTAGYRFTSGVNQLGFNESDLNGFVAGAQVQFGSF
jgi:hypothetical protein